MSKLHFVGIGGGSLNGLAQVMAAAGHQVTGSDLKAEGPVIERLRQQGIEVMDGHAPAHVASDVDEVIISSAVTGGPGAVEVEAAYQAGIPVFKRTELWRRLSGKARIAVAVAGSHGKTTTTALLGHILAEAGLNPTVLVGGDVPDFGGTVRLGSPEVLVVEADEYDRAFLDLRPTVGVITNVDYDHPDTYPHEEDYRRAFQQFARTVNRRRGLLILNGRDAWLRREFSHWKITKRWYDPTRPWPGLRPRLPGDHIKGNAQAAALAATHLGVPANVIKRAVRSFRGVSRRFEYVGQCSGVSIYDDFAHHHTELIANINTAKAAWGKVAVIFQPHQSVRTERFAKEFASALRQADRAALLPIYRVAGREAGNLTDERAIAEYLPEVEIVPTEVGAICRWCQARAAEGHKNILAMGAGTISDLMREACRTT